MADQKALMRRFYDEVMNQGRLEVLDELVADDFVEYEALPGGPTGKDAPRDFVATFRAAFPDMRVTLEDAIEEGDKVVARARLSGTHQGEFMGIPATGSKIDIQMIDIVQIRDGRAIAHWGVSDNLAMLEQLGVVEPPTG
jgi:steroid delta-isomerase-like uncharacterized protein